MLIIRLKKSWDKCKQTKTNIEIKNYFLLNWPDNKLWLILKKQKEKREETKWLLYKSTTNKQKLIKVRTKNLWTNSWRPKPKDSTKWERLNGKEKSKLESTYWRMFINQEKRTYYWSKIKLKKPIGSRITKKNKLKPRLLNKMPNSKRELLKKQLFERTIKWIFWNRWMKKIEFKELSYKKKCTKNVQLNWLN